MDELVSVIVPVYNTEKYIGKCLESILNQTWSRLELIVVNDGSEQNEDAIIRGYMEDRRVKYIVHGKNQGLFRTRIDGVRAAAGRYIAFVDSDDTISRDFLRLLVLEAEKQRSDLTFAKTVLHTPKGKNMINVLQNTALSMLPLSGKRLRDEYFAQGGAAYVWHTVWNKLYTRALWEKCLPYLEELDEHVVMTEDLAFSTVLFCFADKASFAPNSVYYYCRHASAATDSGRITPEGYRKKVTDMTKVFSFLQQFLEREGKEYLGDLIRFRQHFARLWERGITNLEGEAERMEAKRLVDRLCPKKGTSTAMEDGYFELSQAPYSECLDEIKSRIWHSAREYVSFDIFDTAVTRPFFEPTDLFYLLDEEYEKHSDGNTPFHRIRMEGEQGAREACCAEEKKEDITLEQIYRYISDVYGISREICARIMEKEKALEIRFCRERKAVKEIYSLAVLAGKKVLFISDMYLDMETVKSILHKNGYEGYEKIFLSSEHGKLKKSGALFRQALTELGTEGSNVIHIGDNETSDVQIPARYGMEPVYLPKTKDIFFGRNEQFPTNRCSTIGKEVSGAYRDRKGFEHLSGYGAMTAMAANRFFDNPFVLFHPMTDFNMDPYLTGYYALGMSLLGQLVWLERLCRQKAYRRILFMARDGFLLYRAFQIAKKYKAAGVAMEYRYASRRSMLPEMLTGREEFQSLPIVYARYTPDGIADLLEFCLKETPREQWEKDCKKQGFPHDACFSSVSRYHRFMGWLMDYRYCPARHEEAKRRVRKYWSDMKDTDVIFDMGYSASIHRAVTRAGAKRPAAAFVHSDKEKHMALERRGGFVIENLFDFLPSLSGLLREHFFSDPGGSCIAYRESGEGIEPVLESCQGTYADQYPVRMMQKGALDFIEDFYRIFGKQAEYLDIRVPDVLMPFEGFLCTPTKVDTRMFMASFFEDRVYGAVERLNIRDFWLQLVLGHKGCGGKGVAENFADLMKERGKEKLAFFGTGRMCRDILEDTPLPVQIFLDNDPAKSGRAWYGSHIRQPSEVPDLKELFIVIVCAQYMEIEEQLEEMGLVQFQDYITWMEIV